jgi:acetyl esterase/lipase
MKGSGSRATWLGGLAVLCWGLFWGLLALPTDNVRGVEVKAASQSFEIDVKEDITYYEGRQADRTKHQLDVYVPKGVKEFPVLFFVHGGSWSLGDKKGELGVRVYDTLSRSVAHQGIGVVVPNYRLSPRVKHPAHIRDVARAFAWTVKHIKEFGGRTDAIFIAGHSAGGHLVCLLATDPAYLKAEGLSVKAIRGVVAVSGVYRVPPNRLFDGVFGRDPAVRKDASPISHVGPGLPHFLVLCAEQDLPTCGKKEAGAFCAALLTKDNLADLMEMKDRNHISIMFSMVDDADPARRAILTFIRKNTSP